MDLSVTEAMQIKALTWSDTAGRLALATMTEPLAYRLLASAE
jgi:hypothetical protein